MKKVNYTVKDEIGLHARPAGMLVNESKKYSSAVTLKAGTKTADAKKLMAVMALGVKHGDAITLEIEGADEDTAAAELQKFLKAHV